MTRDKIAAGRAVAARLSERGWTATDLMRETGLDSGTIGDLIAGKRWPQAPTRGKVERALGWTYGTIQLIAEGEAVPEPEVRVPARPDLAALIATDPTLSDAARAHFLNQYRLLQQLSAMDVGGDSDEQRILDSDLPEDQKSRALAQLRRNRERHARPQDHKEAQ